MAVLANFEIIISDNSDLARILHEGGRTMLWIYRHLNHLIKNQSLIVRLQFVRAVL